MCQVNGGGRTRPITNGSTISMGSSEYSGSGLFPSHHSSGVDYGPEEEKLTKVVVDCSIGNYI